MAGNYSGYIPMNWDSIMTNPYYLAAANSYNANFKGNTNTDSVSNTNTANGVSNVSNSGQQENPISVVQTEQEDTGVSLGKGIFATALIAAGAYGIIRGRKSGYFEKLWKKVTGKSDSKTVNTVLQKMTAVKNGNNEIKVLVPNKTTTFSGNKIRQGAANYGVSSSISVSRQAFDPQKSVINSFQITTSGDKYTVFVKDGKITKIVSKLMKKDEDVLVRLTNAEASSTDAELLEKFKKIAEELGKEIEEADKSILKDVANIRYSNKYGDDTLNLVMKKYGQQPKLQSFKTLEQFDRSAEAVKKYIHSSSEEVFAGDIINQKGNWLNKKGVLVDGVGVIRCDEEIVRGTRCFFEGENLVRIEENGVVYPSDSFRFKEFIKDNQKAVDEFKKNVFEDRIAAKIPKGAVIGVV